MHKSIADMYIKGKESEQALIAVDICPVSQQWYRLNKRTDYYSSKFSPIFKDIS
jgi:hypothetical protein